MNKTTSENWSSIRLKYLATINDEALPENTDSDFEISYLDIGNVKSTGEIEPPTTYSFVDAPSRARRIVRNGDVIVSTVRTYLQAIAPIENPPENLIVSTGFAVVRPRPDVLNANFCKYCLRESAFLTEVEKRSVGVSYPAINSSELGDILIYTPSLSIQPYIAEHLDRETAHIDALIQAKENLLTMLAEKRQALITNAVTRGLDPNVPLKPSGVDWLGDVPEHWGMVQLKFLAQVPLQYGANEAASDDNPDNPRFIRITDIDENGNLRPETFRSLEPELAEPYLLEDGDILLARSGATVGKAFMYRDLWGKACFAGYLIRFRCNLDKLLPEFFIKFTESHMYWSQVNEGLIQATIPNFSGEKYGVMFIPVPEIDEQIRVVNFLQKELGKINELKFAAEKTIILLKERRSALITAAVTGQIEISHSHAHN